MKKNILIVLGLHIFSIIGQDSLAGTIHTWQDHDLNIFAGSPPALIFVQDSQNNITGADPAKGLNNYGQGTVVQEISKSWVEQEHTGSDAVSGTFVPNAATSWSISIPDHGPESFVVNLVGVTTGVTALSISGLFAIKLKIPQIENDLNILVANGVTKQIRVTFDSINRSLITTPTIKAGDFLRDTQSACNLKDIAPEAACDVLEALASGVEKAISKGDVDKERLDLELYMKILNRLHNWSDKDARHDWDDFKDHPECDGLRKDKDDTKFFAKDPAYSALKLDAQTLLDGLK